MHPAAAATHINHTLGVRTCQARLGREQSYLNYAAASLLGQAIPWKVKCGGVVYVCFWHMDFTLDFINCYDPIA